ncbi:hypothetical protein FOA52_012728 [Chlamydomonas sp. UWO 241]|nr:hypothetical protein FOA52_012728 [Chlamydomonas sp. UWO 241]
MNANFHLEVLGLKRELEQNRVLFGGVTFSLKSGDVLFIAGPSGVGKTLLLRSIACLDDVQGGKILLDGRPPEEVGFPDWRAQVCYVPQSRVNFAGTPTEFYFQAQQFTSQKGRPRGDLPSLIHELGLEQTVLNQAWSTLSGGQAQRVALAIAVALRPLVLLLDEPSSACDPVSTRRVEKVLKESGAALVWVTHDVDQPLRVGGRLLELPGCRLTPLPTPTLPPGTLTPSVSQASLAGGSDVSEGVPLGAPITEATLGDERQVSVK